MVASAMVRICWFHAVILRLALLSQTSAAYSCPSEVDGFGDAASLLQQRAQPANGRLRSAEEAWGVEAANIAAGASGTRDEAVNTSRRPGKRAVAFQGGGFIAQADYIGLVVGLLRILPSVRGTPEGSDLGALFKNFDTMVGVSGGAWFASQLVYSKKFNDLIYLSAAAPQQTAMLLDAKYFAPVLNPLTNTSLWGTAKGLAKCLKDSLSLIVSKLKPAPSGSSDSTAPSVSNDASWYSNPYYLPWDMEILAEAIILIQQGGISWEDLVVQMLHRGAEIDPSMTLGSDAANAWAKKKLFVQGVTVVTPSPEAETDNAAESFTRVHVKGIAGDKHHLSYTASGPRNGVARTTFTPAKFSVVVGGGEAQASPLPFCATKDCFGLELNYAYLGEKATVGLEGLFNTSFEKHAGLLPVGSTAAVSSAFEGKAALKASFGAQQGCIDLAVWAAPGVDGGQAFAAGRSYRDQLFAPFGATGDVLAKAAGDGFQPFIDGGDTDATGIGHALASGAEEILVFVNIGEGTVKLESFVGVFEGSPDPQKVMFSKPTLKDFETMLTTNQFTSIPALPNSRFLQRILFGSVPAVTADNPWFGISAGREIELGFIAVDTSNITRGLIQENFSYNNFFDFGTTSGEIANTLRSKENKGATQAMLQKFFI